MLDSASPRKDNEWDDVHEKAVWEKPKKRFRLGLAIVMLILLTSGIAVGSKIVIFAQKIIESSGGKFHFKDFFMGGNKPLKGEEAGLIRILLFGIGGEGHDGPNLTDTMILATIKLDPDEKTPTQVSLVSIPRDLVAQLPDGNGFRKINSAYALGEIGGRKLGAAWAMKTVEQITGESVPYYGLADFKGFEKVIDDLGGLDITVDRAFTDELYPDEKAGYLPPVSFSEGLQHMDGARALQFVRSRHGGNGEGSDFARSRRQEKVLRALKEKVVKINLLTNLGVLNQIMDDLANHVRTNVQPYEMKRLYDLTRDLKAEQIKSAAIDVESGLVCNATDEATAAYILIPCRGLGDYSAIRQFVQNQFASDELGGETASVEIQNAAKIDFLGQQAKTFLERGGLTVSAVNFKSEISYTRTVIYDNTAGKKPKTLEYLKKNLNNSEVAKSAFPFPTVSSKPDFVVVLAADLKDKFGQK